MTFDDLCPKVLNQTPFIVKDCIVNNVQRRKAKYSDIRYGDVILNHNKPAQAITKLGRQFFDRENPHLT